MTKLLILDKDGTLVCPRSGAKFVQHPEDQELLPNVAETLRRYDDDGWTMAIASNQGGCDIHDVAVAKLQAGMIVYLPDEPNSKIRRIDSSNDDYVDIFLEDESFLTLGKNDVLGIQYKTLADAIAEMQYAMKLTGVHNAYFCPDFEGKECWHVKKNFAQSLAHKYRNGIGEPYKGKYRKPGHGMISQICLIETFPTPTSVLFVGDRPEDKQAALNAGVSFQWAKDFFGWDTFAQPKAV